jgi:glycosyltransferase involved in cell wall biosynthesis
MAKITLVAHRYYPYPGGTENTVRRAAEALHQAGHDVIVYAAGHQGPQNGVDVNFEITSLYNRDLIIIHGAGVWVQDQIISNIKHINSPVLFWLIRPDETTSQQIAVDDAALIGWTTRYDIDCVKKRGGDEQKLHYIRHVLTEESEGSLGFKERNGISTEKMFLSSGGFWPHKGHQELINVFEESLSLFPDTTLVITGYTGLPHGLHTTTDYVKVLYLENHSDVYDAMKEADLYIMNSYDEGYGLVLLESMINKTPWISRHIAGADDLQKWGSTYSNRDELIQCLISHKKDVDAAYDFVKITHSPNMLVQDVESAIQALVK